MQTTSDIKQEPGTPEPAVPAKGKRETMSKKANLVFPVARVDRLLREGKYSTRYSKEASIYLTSVLECMSGKIIKKAGEETIDAGRVVIAPKDLMKGIRRDQQLTMLLGGPNNIQIANARDA